MDEDEYVQLEDGVRVRARRIQEVGRPPKWRVTIRRDGKEVHRFESDARKCYTALIEGIEWVEKEMMNAE